MTRRPVLPTEAPALTIAICTFRRPELLAACLRSALAQTDLAAGALEILVVDNCPDASARATVEALDAERIRYRHEPRTSLAHARNAAVAAATGRLLAFVDDDNRLPSRWARSAIDLMADDALDLVFGDIVSVFADGVAPERRRRYGRYFERRLGDGGQRRLAPGRSGHIESTSTCNMLARREVVFPPALAPWFDPMFGAVGGEDTDYIMRRAPALAAGRIAASSALEIEEFVPEGRLDDAYILSRFHRSARVYSALMLRHSRRRTLTSAYLVATGLAQTAYHGLRLAAWRLLGRQPPLERRVELAMALGKLRWRGVIAEAVTPYR